MGLKTEIIERQFHLMNRTGPTVKIAVQQIKYECIRYANEIVRENGGESLADIQRIAISETRTELKNILARIRANKRKGNVAETQV